MFLNIESRITTNAELDSFLCGALDLIDALIEVRGLISAEDMDKFDYSADIGVSPEEFRLSLLEDSISCISLEQQMKVVKSVMIGELSYWKYLNTSYMFTEMLFQQILMKCSNVICLTSEDRQNFLKFFDVHFGNLVYGMYKTLSLDKYDAAKENGESVVLSGQYKAWLSNYGHSLEKLSEKFSVMMYCFAPIVNFDEEISEKWTKFIDMFPKSIRSDIIDMSEFVYLYDIVGVLNGSIPATGDYIDRLQERSDNSDILLSKLYPDEWRNVIKLVPEAEAKFLYDNEDKITLMFIKDVLNTKQFSEELLLDSYARFCKEQTAVFGG